MNQSNTRGKNLAAAAAAFVLCMVAGSALAQDRHDDRGPDRFQPQQAQQPQWQQQDHFDRRGGPRFHHERQDFRDNEHRDFHPGHDMDRRGFPQPHAEWRRGDRVPREFRGRNYVVNDWRGQRLQAPPRGYQWVGVGGDFVLTAVATGIIAQIVIGQ